MANFGTYEGHRILSDAMDSTLNRQLKKDQLKVANKKIEGEIALNQIKIDEYREDEARRLERERQIRHNQTSRLSANDLVTTDEQGNQVFAPDAAQTLQNYNKSFSMANILTGDANNVLTADDRQQILNNMTSLAVDDIAALKKLPMFYGQSEDEIKTTLENNPKIYEQLNFHQMDTGINQGESVQSVLANNQSIDSVLGEAMGFGASDYVSAASQEKGWGGGIMFKGLPSAKSADKDKYTTILEALRTSKNLEKNKTIPNVSDKMWIEQKGDNEWWVEERDLLDNDRYRVEFKDGVPYINVDGNDVRLNEMMDWEP